MNVLSLFDGMSCGQLALNRVGIKPTNYYACEIDKYAIQITQKNYPNTIQLGDVQNINTKDLPKIDLLMGGSPCQGFSFAGSQLAFDDPRSKLFFEFVKLLKELKPKNFLLENVRMKKEYLSIITEHLGVEPILINSALVSAQNRQRYYWTNLKVEQPKDRGIVLKDILQNETNELPVKDTKRNQRHYRKGNQKSLCMTATMYKGAGNNGMTLVETKPKQEIHNKPNKIHDIPKDVLKDNERQRRVYDKYGKSPTLLARSDSPKVMKINKPKQVGIATDINGHDILKRIYSPTGKSPTINSMNGGNREPKVAIDDIYWRKLTTVECSRLQNVPDNYCDGVSNSQKYKMLGNGWNVETVAHIFKNLC